MSRDVTPVTVVHYWHKAASLYLRDPTRHEKCKSTPCPQAGRQTQTQAVCARSAWGLVCGV
eukprot:2897238-Rhodomonas_salina.1